MSDPAQAEIDAKKEKKKAKDDKAAQKAAQWAAKQKKLEEEKKRLEEKKKLESQDPNAAEKKGKKKKEVVEEPAFVDTTTPGEKKDVKVALRNSYEPKAVEAAWYAWWEKCGFFQADNQSKKEKFVIVIPPPNVTGSLHMGHALTNSVQDSIVRRKRMEGKEALWVPGIDHAGIATQSVVERRLVKEKGLDRHALGREAFVNEVWKWKNEYGERIYDQLRKLGSSLDWSRKAFTMDEKLSYAVEEAFIRMFKDGLIYRDNRLVNWCCKLNTAISDIEVKHIELSGHTKMGAPGHDPKKQYDFGILLEFAYPLENGEEIVVATTRPETMLGDTAIAVHPDDPRYKHLHGKFAIHPFNGRRIPIITDAELVQMEFGTGAVKITPAHDPNDYICGKKHDLPFINILNDDGTLNEEGAPFQGLKRFDARDAVIKGLKEKGLYKGIKHNPMSLATCSRSKDVIEPLIKPQWWVSCKSMANAAMASVENGEIKILPEFHRATWFRWLGDIRDWCISRQLWWGHRCPAYLVSVKGQPEDWDDKSRWVVGHNQQEALQMAKEKFPEIPADQIVLHQDPDVLDTWFSSGIFPFSVFGWPENTADMQAFYPTSLLETGHDILFFWVARMVMMGIQLTGKNPFSEVLLHAMVRDANGKKMSKDEGNVIDPVDMINGVALETLIKQLESGNLLPEKVEKAKEVMMKEFPKGIPECGTDAVRFALCAYTTQGRNINLDVKRVVSFKNFCNKLWNATKFALTNLGENFKPAEHEPVSGLTPGEKWILSRLNHAVKTVETYFKTYDFAEVTTAIYNFWWYELCDIYLEVMKPLIYSGNFSEEVVNSARQTLYTCLDAGLRLLHPFMPFVTEELWQRLPQRPGLNYPSIMITPAPAEVQGRTNEEIEKEMKFAQELIDGVRSMKAAFNLTAIKPKIFINLHDETKFNIMKYNYHSIILTLTKSEEVNFTLNNASAPEGCAVEIPNKESEIYLLLKGVVDIPTEIKKLTEKKTKTSKELSSLQAKIASPSYAKVPEDVKQDNAVKLESLSAEINTLTKAIANLEKAA